MLSKSKKLLKPSLSKIETLKSSRLSLNSLFLFVLVFGAIGAYILFKSFAASTPENIAYGDLNGDNTVNIQDLSTLLTSFGTTNGGADINSDNNVNIIDLSILLSHYGTSVPVQVGIYYVDPNGNDSNNGQSSPWKTVQHAVDTVPTGATIRLNAGTYTPFAINKASITVTNTSGATPVIQGQAGVQDVIRINSSNVTVSGLNVTGCVPNGSPAGGRLEDFGSSGVRINDNTTGVIVSGMTIHDSHGTNSEGMPIGCYGIMVHYANSSTVSNNNIYHNGEGISVIGGGQNVQVINNQIHDNDVIIRNTNVGGEDFGGTAVSLAYINTTTTPGPLVKSNTIYTNAGPSHDYTVDGSGIEIFRASNLTIDSNDIFNNPTVLETGTNNGFTCSNNKLINNTLRGTNISGYPVLPNHAYGMFLRCNDHMLIDGNAFTNLYGFTANIETGGNFGGAIDGLTITNNTITQTGDRVWALSVDPTGHSFTINNNHYHVSNAVFAAAFGWSTATWANLAAWRSATGFDLSGTTF